MWVHKYRPRRLDEIVGNQNAVEMIRQYNWKKPLIIYGAPGTGKSSLVEAFANEAHYDLVEINDKNISSARSISETGSLFGGKKLILIDNVEEAENIKEIEELVKSTKNPMVLITTDFKSRRLSTIKKFCEGLQMRRLPSASIEKFLMLILKKEQVVSDPGIVKKIAENSNGDLRAAINDLETAAAGGEIAKNYEVSPRDSAMDIYKAMNAIFARDMDAAIKSTWDLNEEPKDVLLWIDENLPHIYKEKNMVDAYYYLSRADIFLGRISSKQYWDFLRYVNLLMTAGTNVSKPKKMQFIPYRFPSYFMKMGWTKKERELKKSIGEKMSSQLHVSSKIVANEYIPLFKNLIKAGNLKPEEIAEHFNLDSDEVDYLSSK